MTRPRQVLTDERGLAEIPQVMFLTLAVLGFVLLLTFAGRQATTRNRIEHTAEAAAQAAALQRSPTAAVWAATHTATTGLGDGCGGRPPEVTVDTTTWAPGGIVTVTVRCDIPTGDLQPLPLPGTLTMSAHSAAVIDRYRTTTVTP